MTRLQTCTALAVCASLALAAVATGTAEGAEPDIVLTEQDAGKDITLHDGQRLIIKLPHGGGSPYGWFALMYPDSILAFTPAPKETPKKPPANGHPMLGGQEQTIFAFMPARFTESSSLSFMLIYCGPQCDIKDSNARVFKIGVTTTKK